MKQKTTRYWILSACMLTLCVGMPGTSEARTRKLDALTGIDQSYTSGYTYRTFQQDYQTSENEAYEFIERPKEAAESAVSEFETTEQGQWTYLRSASAGMVYNSNPLTVRQAARDDVTQTVSSTLGMTRRADRSYVEMFYDVSYTNHVTFEESNRATHRGTVGLTFDLNRLQIKLKDSFTPSTARVRGNRTELVADDPGSDTVSTLTNNASADFAYKYSEKTLLDFQYTNSLIYFPTPSNTDRSPNAGFSSQVHRIRPGISYQVLPRTRVSAAYGFERSDFFQGGQFGSRAYDGSIGFDTRLGPRMGAFGSVTFGKTEYELASLGELRTHSFEAGFSRKLTPKINGTLTYSSSVIQNFDAVNLGIVDQTENFTGLGFTWRISPKLSAGLSGSIGVVSREGLVTRRDPENPTLTFTREREDVLYEWGFELAWEPRKYLSVLLAYDFTNANSSFVDFEYEQQRLGGSLNFVY